MSYRLIVGGPCNSGKSSIVLSLVAAFREAGMTAEAIELDVWSNSYPAFNGDIPFEGRPKRTGLDWDWKTPLEARIAAFNASTADLVLGDLPGKLDEIVDFVCTRCPSDGALVISRTAEGLETWTERFTSLGLPVALHCITFKHIEPMIVTALDRTVDPAHGGVQKLVDALLSSMTKP